MSIIPCPTISVVLTVYNGKEFLNQAVESILAQTCTDYEFIIVDDGSTDGSTEIIEQYARSDGRIRTISQSNQGLSRALNAGISLANGEFIARMDADDIALPTRFERQLRFLQQNPHIGAIGCLCPVIDSRGVLLPNRVLSPGTGSTWLKWKMLFGSPIEHPAAMIRRDALAAVGGYTPDILAQDYDLWLRLSPTTLLENIPEPLLLYRVHDKSITGSRREQQISDAARSRQRFVRRVYGIEISLSQSIAIYTSVTASNEEAVVVTRLMMRIWNEFNRLNPSVPLKEYIEIYREYVSRLYRLWKFRRQPWRALRFIGWRDVALLSLVLPIIVARKLWAIARVRRFGSE